MPTKIDWKASIWAGIIAGLGYMMIAMALIMMIQHMSPWGPPRMMAAMVMGKGVLPPPATFDLMIMMVAMMVHLVLSIILAIILGWAISRFSWVMAEAIVVGMIFGIIVYIVDFYVVTDAGLFSWFAMNRSATILLSHAMFGAIAGGVYRAIAAHDAKKAGEAGATGVHA